MIQPEKVYLMTKAAAFEKREAHRALKIVNYRRKDYVLSRMLLVLLSPLVVFVWRVIPLPEEVRLRLGHHHGQH